jgi:anti-sigma-K factor RskA
VSAAPHDLTGAYAVDALPDADREAFERHLEACPACAREVRGFQAAAARLGTADTIPPSGLWERIRDEVAVTPQLPPAGLRAGRRWFPPLLAAATALVLLAMLSVTALNLGQVGRSGRAARTADQIAAVLAAPDARRVEARPSGAGKVAVVVSRERGRAVFVADGLAAAPAGRTYQLWLLDRTGPRSAGLVQVGDGGRVSRLLDGPVTGHERVAMTVERRGGVERPTSAPVVVVDLA